jgi:UDP-N-acetylenolpyruvoylglucosamine reductase
MRPLTVVEKEAIKIAKQKVNAMIKGDPVYLKMGDSQILIDYQVARKALRLTNNFQRKIFTRSDLLVIEFAGKNNKGFIELYQFQGHEGLENLPVVDLGGQS